MIDLELLQATEAAAVASSKFIGKGDKNAADLEATLAMRDSLNSINFAGRIAIGEGIKDNAPGLFRGELVGAIWKKIESEESSNYSPVECHDIAVDPLDGTTQVARGGYEAMSVLTIGKEGSLFHSEEFYMRKLAVGPHIANKVELSIKDDLPRIIKLVAVATRKMPYNITVCLLDRPRHQKMIETLRGLGCRLKLMQDCDVCGALCTAIPESGVDVYMGIGGTPEGVIAACGLKCLNGFFEGMLCSKEGELVDDRVLKMEDLAKGEVAFCATGITDGSLLRGLKCDNFGYMTTQSLFLKPNTIRWINNKYPIT